MRSRSAIKEDEEDEDLDVLSMYLVDLSLFNDFRAAQALCGCVAVACDASAPLEKNMSLDLLSTYLVDVFDVCRF